MMERISDDFSWIAENAQNFAAGFQIVIFANKMDQFVEEEKRNEWINEKLPEIEQTVKDSLGPYQQHFMFISPCSLLSNITRTNAISLAFKAIAEINSQTDDENY